MSCYDDGQLYFHFMLSTYIYLSKHSVSASILKLCDHNCADRKMIYWPVWELTGTWCGDLLRNVLWIQSRSLSSSIQLKGSLMVAVGVLDYLLFSASFSMQKIYNYTLRKCQVENQNSIHSALVLCVQCAWPGTRSQGQMHENPKCLTSRSQRKIQKWIMAATYAHESYSGKMVGQDKESSGTKARKKVQESKEWRIFTNCTSLYFNKNKITHLT